MWQAANELGTAGSTAAQPLSTAETKQQARAAPRLDLRKGVHKSLLLPHVCHDLTGSPPHSVPPAFQHLLHGHQRCCLQHCSCSRASFLGLPLTLQAAVFAWCHRRLAIGLWLAGQTGSFLGMAPEVTLLQPYNEKADIFSLGCCIVEVGTCSACREPDEQCAGGMHAGEPQRGYCG